MGQSNNPVLIKESSVDFSGAASRFVAAADRAGVRAEPVRYFPTGRSASMENVRRLIDQVAGSAMPVLITGEPGAGKEWVARYIHALSPRADQPFIAVDCGAVSPDSLESELFGHEKGAVPGAISARKGRIEAAEGGTFFLDDSADIASPMRVKLVRVLRERVYQRVGSYRNRPCDVRIIVAAHSGPRAAGSDGQIRDTHYFGINNFPIELPPLRERIDDLADLVESIGARCAESGLMPAQPTPGAIRILKHYQWPGNVRELANLIERLSVLRPGGRVDIADLPTQFTDKVPLRITDKEDVATLRISGPQPQDFELPDGSIPLKRYIENIEITLIRRALREMNGVTAHAARHLQLRRTTLAEKMKRYGIRSDDDPSMP